MRASPTLSESTLAAVRDTDADSLQELIRLLVRRASAGNRDVDIPPEPDSEEVILDAEIDGGRYLLIRLPKSAPSSVRLSPREQEIVRMVAQGHSNKIIADVLNISSWTVCTHLRRVFGKLGVGSRAAMVARLPEIARTRHPSTSKSSPHQAIQPTPIPESTLYDSRQVYRSLRSDSATRRNG
jgi:DNA-binding CsgD family transcriptional regulator